MSKKKLMMLNMKRMKTGCHGKEMKNPTTEPETHWKDVKMMPLLDEQMKLKQKEPE